MEYNFHSFISIKNQPSFQFLKKLLEFESWTYVIWINLLLLFYLNLLILLYYLFYYILLYLYLRYLSELIVSNWILNLVTFS